MKKFLLLISLFGLCACDFQQVPECWDETIQNELKEATYTVKNTNANSKDFGKDITYNVVSIPEIVEIPSNITANPVKNARLCNVKITFADGKTRNFKYKAVYLKHQTGKKSHIMGFEEF